MSEPIRYIDRTRAYYQALGYAAPYVWAKHADAPFAGAMSLQGRRVAIVTTAAPFDPAFGDQGPGAAYNAQAKFYDVYRCPSTPVPDLRISHVAYDRVHSLATDPATWLPLAALARANRCRPADDVYGLPTNRSQATTLNKDCPLLLEMLQADGVAAAIFVPNCPVCHQTVSLAARLVEGAGIRTVVMGCAKDIVEQVRVPRFVFSDFPLGNGAGRPHDAASQDYTIGLALDLLEQAIKPTTVQSELSWLGKDNWKNDYSNAALLSPAEIAEKRAAFDAGKATAAAKRR